MDEIQPWKPREWAGAGHLEDDRLNTLEYLQLIRVGHNKLRKLPELLGELRVSCLPLLCCCAMRCDVSAPSSPCGVALSLCFLRCLFLYSLSSQ